MSKSVEFLKENYTYSSENLKQFGFSNENILKLVKNKIFKRLGDCFISNFVGFIEIEDKTFISLPKYRKTNFTDDELNDFKNIFYHFSNISVISSELKFSYELANEICFDFVALKNFKNHHFSESNDWSDACWEDLLIDCDNFHNGHPILLEPKTKIKIKAASLDVDYFQKQAVAFVLNKFPELAKTYLIEPIQLTETEEQIIAFFNGFLKETKFYREKRMAKNYIRFLEKENVSISFLGSTSFHVIWESICKVMFSDQSSKYIKEFPKPAYHLTSGSYNLKGHIPDVINLSHDKQCFVIDAKYYDIVKGLPQTNDLFKQTAYYEHCEKLFSERTIYNFFVFPNEQELDVEKFGYGEYTIISDEPISLFSYKDTYIFKQFLNKKTLNPKMLLN
jgi:hypothetical protein